MMKQGKLFSLILLLLTCFALPVFAQNSVKSENSKVSLLSEMDHVAPGNPFWMALQFELEDHWHIYWENPGDSGLPVQLDWELPEGISAQAVQWPAPKRIEVGGLMNYGYEGQPTLLIPMMALDDLVVGQKLEIKLKANWLICKDICIPESGKFSITLQSAEVMKASNEEVAIKEAVASLPSVVEHPAYYEVESESSTVEVKIPTLYVKDLESAYLYSRSGGVLKHTQSQEWEADENGLEGKLELDNQSPPEYWGAVLEVIGQSGTRYYDVTLESDPKVLDVNDEEMQHHDNRLTVEESEPDNATGTGADVVKERMGILEALFLAFIGGLLLNAMPCVFPVLALKALALSQKVNANAGFVRLQGLSYLVGVVFSFVLLAVVLIAFRQGGESLGWGFQLQSPAFVAALVYLFVMLGLALAGMFELPILFGGLASHREEKDSVKGSFFTGVLAVIVATPCTVPFMAPAIGYAFVQPALITLLIMVALGVGLAFPYVAISFYPALQRIFPRPGMWMELFKQFMAFPMFATAAWLLWVLVQQTGPDGLMRVMATVLTFVFLLWLGQITQNRIARSFYWLVGLSVLIYSQVLLTAVDATSGGMREVVSASQHEKVSYSAQKLQSLREEKQPVFVNATAAWCITCKVNERLALSSDKLANYMKEKNIVFMVADWTNYDDEITAFLQKYDRQGVPLYVYFPAEGEPVVLPQLLTESLVLEKLGATE